MVEQRLPLHAPGLTRALGLLVLLAGIVVMHTAVFAMTAHGEHGAMTAGHGTTMPTVGVSSQAGLTPGNHAAAETDCADDECGGSHGAMHGCVFILAAVTFLLALAMRYRLAADQPAEGVARLRHPRPRRERAPPWTVLSLAQLSILRV